MSNLDPVNPKAVKKKFDDRKDKDIDNDGDVDSSDEYLHKRRKAISKALTKESVDLEENVNALAKEFENRITKGGSIASDRVQEKERMAVLAMGKKKGMDMKALDAAMIKVMNRVNEEVDISEAKVLDNMSQLPKGSEKALKSMAQVMKDASRMDMELTHIVKDKQGKKVVAAVTSNANGSYKIVYVNNNGVAPLKEEVELDEAVNVKAIQKAVDDGKSMDVIMTMFANKRTTNTDEIRKVVKDYMWKKRMKKEEVELDEGNMASAAKELEAYARKSGGIDKGDFMKAVVMMKKGMKPQLNKFVDDLDTEPREKILHIMKKHLGEEVEHLEEKYETNHKTFSSAVQHAKDQVQKRGYEIDGEEWSRKVALGPKKPSKGKTNRYTISLMKGGKETKKNLQMQVYYDEGRYELNMYID